VSWIQTASGRRFWPLNPKPEDVCIEDIAHALAMKCRFGGHSQRFYSVAEHSVHVALAVRPELRLAALLHDAAEAYLADIPRPVKPLIAEWSSIEAAVDTAIAAKFGIPRLHLIDPEIKKADTALLLTEGRALMGTTEGWGIDAAPLDATIHGWPPTYAEKVFLSEFRRAEGEGW
jgi:hypothetical protein